MRYHGNYCGPNWSAGKVQPSVDGQLAPIDEFDQTCQVHDRAYARGQQLRNADLQFARENLGTLNPKRWLAGTLVGLQGLLRPTDLVYPTPINDNQPTMSKRQTKMQSRLRGASGVNKMQPMAQTQARLVRANGPTANNSTQFAPVAVATRRTGKSAVIGRIGSRTTVSHRTFLGPISAEGGYTVTRFSANPALAGTFPWLSTLAARYDKYRFSKLKFEYRSVCPTSKPGVIMMSFDYNAADSTPTSKLIQAQTMPNAESNVWVSTELTVPCDEIFRFTRQSTVPNTDVKTYDFGTLFISSQYGDGTVGGELYVEYTVELEKPTEKGNLSQYIVATPTAVGSPLSNAANRTEAPPFEITSGTVLTAIVGGTYSFSIEATGTVITALTLPTIASINGGSVTVFNSPLINSGATKAMHYYRVICGRGDTLSFSAALSATTVTLYSLGISPFTNA